MKQYVLHLLVYFYKQENLNKSSTKSIWLHNIYLQTVLANQFYSSVCICLYINFLCYILVVFSITSVTFLYRFY